MLGGGLEWLCLRARQAWWPARVLRFQEEIKQLMLADLVAGDTVAKLAKVLQQIATTK